MSAYDPLARIKVKPSERRPLFDDGDAAAVQRAVRDINDLIMKTRQGQAVDITSEIIPLTGEQHHRLKSLLEGAGWRLISQNGRNEEGWTLQESHGTVAA